MSEATAQPNAPLAFNLNLKKSIRFKINKKSSLIHLCKVCPYLQSTHTYFGELNGYTTDMGEISRGG